MGTNLGFLHLNIDRNRALRLGALVFIVLIAAALRFSNLEALGYANHYYAAAVKSMLQSWHNFFFVAAEPGGAVSIDKPPVGLWLQTISAYLFGVNGFALLLPQIVAGILSVVVVYHLVRRTFGTAAGLLAALALAITPVVVATDRNNTMDSTLILTLLLAAWAFIKATESGKFRFLLLGAVLVGIGFNIKMLQAYLPLPAFLLLYFLGAKGHFWRKAANIVLAGVVLAIVSFSWATIVDLTPVDQRPYVGSSGDNSVYNLAIGYNGMQRLIGMRGSGDGGNILTALFGGGNADGRDGRLNQAMAGDDRVSQSMPGGDDWSSSNRPAFDDGNAPIAPNGDGVRAGPNGDGPTGTAGNPPSDGSNGPQGGGGMAGSGPKGIQRLFTQPLDKEVSWFLPIGIFGALTLLF